MTAGLLVTAVVLCAAGLISWPGPARDPRLGRGSGEIGQLGSEAAIAAHLIAVVLKTGVPVSLAVQRAAGELRGDIGRDLFSVVTASERGVAPEQAWSTMPELWEPVAAALIVASRAGVPPSDLLVTAAGAMLRRESAARESAIARAGVRLVLPLGAVLLPAFMCTTVVPVVLAMTRGHFGP
ncbi:MAG: type II secretion system F family protein [Actinomycetia bacterium]|nr:type II secretion system F family protein [Actinomycetes bacterium]